MPADILDKINEILAGSGPEANVAPTSPTAPNPHAPDLSDLPRSAAHVDILDQAAGVLEDHLPPHADWLL